MLMRVSCVFTLLAVLVLAGRSATEAAAADEMRGEDLVKQLAAAQSGGADVDLSQLTVTGDVDLSELRVIDRPLRCLDCTFKGEVDASDVVFRSVVELVGATFENVVDAHGATFEGGVVLDSADFRQDLILTGAQFGGLVSFEGTNVSGTATFDRSVYRSRAVFTGSAGGSSTCPRTGSFGEGTSFRGVVFLDVALFRQRCFAGPATFDGASFTGAADFSLTSHFSRSSFVRAVFHQGASFAAARFFGAARFENGSMSGRMIFDLAEFRADAVFSHMTGQGVLELDDVVVDQKADAEPIRLTEVTIDGLSMGFDTVAFIDGRPNQQAAFALIEETAREQGETGRANDAHYQLLQSQNADLPAPERVLDKVFYGAIAGYLVEPWHPLFWLIVLAAVGAVVRALPAWRRAIGRQPCRLRILVVEVFAGLTGGLVEALRQSWGIRTRPGPLSAATRPNQPLRLRPYAPVALRWSEWLSVKVLIAVALLAIANAAPSIRTLIDSVL